MRITYQRKNIRDKAGQCYLLGLCGPEDSQALAGMYEIFEPKNLSQGLPPQDENACREWVVGLVGKADNFLVWDGNAVVGHSALLVDSDRRDAEYIIFVLAPYRGRRLGSALTEAAIGHARNQGLEVVWLTVESHNFRAIRLYKKYGFNFIDDIGWERMMALRL